MARPRSRFVWWALASAGVAAVLLLVATAVAAWLLQPATLKARAEERLSTALHLDAHIGSLAVAYGLGPRVTGSELELRIPNRPELPPFIKIAQFSVDVSPFAAMRGHISAVSVDGLEMVAPSSGGSTPRSTDDGRAFDRASMFIVDRIDSRNGRLTILRAHPKDPPLVFELHSIRVDRLNLDQPVHFVASLTNPLPEGVVDTEGTFGPWPGADVWDLPVNGRYKLSHAKLSTIAGIQGDLTSDGQYSGRLAQIVVTGHTTTPDFNVDLGGRPVPLASTFKATVDASNGTTRLDQVDATMFQTALSVQGLVATLPGPNNHSIDLKVAVTRGRIEDLLTTVIDSPTPVLTGDVTLRTTLSLPPGPEPVQDRIRLNGQVGLGAAEFSDAEIQRKLEDLSRRGQGKPEGEMPEGVMSDLSGTFALAKGVLTLRGLIFHVPGAKVNLSGTYTLVSGALDFHGTLTMQATVSQAIGGFRSIFVKPFDPLFKKGGAGAVLPIVISGTRDHPKFGLEVGKVIKSGH